MADVNKKNMQGVQAGFADSGVGPTNDEYVQGAKKVGSAIANAPSNLWNLIKPSDPKVK